MKYLGDISNEASAAILSALRQLIDEMGKADVTHQMLIAEGWRSLDLLLRVRERLVLEAGCGRAIDALEQYLVPFGSWYRGMLLLQHVGRGCIRRFQLRSWRSNPGSSNLFSEKPSRQKSAAGTSCLSFVGGSTERELFERSWLAVGRPSSVRSSSLSSNSISLLSLAAGLPQQHRTHLEKILSKHAPKKLPSTGLILFTWFGREDALVARLQQKYAFAPSSTIASQDTNVPSLEPPELGSLQRSIMVADPSDNRVLVKRAIDPIPDPLPQKAISSLNTARMCRRHSVSGPVSRVAHFDVDAGDTSPKRAVVEGGIGLQLIVEACDAKGKGGEALRVVLEARERATPSAYPTPAAHIGLRLLVATCNEASAGAPHGLLNVLDSLERAEPPDGGLDRLGLRLLVASYCEKAVGAHAINAVLESCSSIRRSSSISAFTERETVRPTGIYHGTESVRRRPLFAPPRGNLWALDLEEVIMDLFGLCDVCNHGTVTSEDCYNVLVELKIMSEEELRVMFPSQYDCLSINYAQFKSLLMDEPDEFLRI